MAGEPPLNLRGMTRREGGSSAGDPPWRAEEPKKAAEPPEPEKKEEFASVVKLRGGRKKDGRMQRQTPFRHYLQRRGSYSS